MQSYQGNANDYIRRGNYGRSGRNNCQAVSSAPVSVCENRTLAMAFVPWQSWQKIYSPEQAFKIGTIFEELNKPFQGMGGCR